MISTGPCSSSQTVKVYQAGYHALQRMERMGSPYLFWVKRLENPNVNSNHKWGKGLFIKPNHRYIMMNSWYIYISYIYHKFQWYIVYYISYRPTLFLVPFFPGNLDPKISNHRARERSRKRIPTWGGRNTSGRWKPTWGYRMKNGLKNGA